MTPDNPSPQPSALACCVAELLGTFVLIFFGLGAVHVAVTTGATSGVLQVGLTWGIGVMAGAYAVGHVSGGHLNPAVTLAMAAWNDFPRRLVIPYWLSQTAGAALAALVIYCIFADSIAAHEAREGIQRGAENSVKTASMYGEYFPNPGVELHGWSAAGHKNLSVPAAFLAELVGTAILAASVFALTDKQSSGAPPQSNLALLFIGLIVAGLIVVLGPMTQACLNPARDFGPRIVAYFAGWKDIAFPGPRGAGATLAVYLAAPLLGAVVGGGIYAKVLRGRR